jgi:hypothetical protein
MRDETLARKILEILARAFPRKLHLQELQATLPEYKGLPAQEWLSAVQALRLEGELNGKFLPHGTSIADAAALYITERGRLQLRETEEARMETKPGLQVFICHSSGDREFVRTLYTRLKSDGFTPWLDEENILPGQEWDSEIRQAVRASDVVVVCLSESSITKEGYVQKEIKLALDVAEEKPEGTIFLIPARLEGCQVPRRLGGWQWVDLFEVRGYERLVAALRTRKAQRHIRPNASGSSRSAGQRPIHAKHEAPLSLAETMKRALAEHGAAEEVARSKQKRYQTNWKRGMSFLAGVTTLGALLGAVKNASAVVTPMVTVVGTALCLLAWFTAEIVIRVVRPTWVFPSGQRARLTAFGLRPRWFLIGFVLLLWIPRAADFVRQRVLESTQPSGPTVEFRRHPQ